jgi:hypothetical protein
MSLELDRKNEGVTPVNFLNAALNVTLELNPTVWAIPSME